MTWVLTADRDRLTVSVGDDGTGPGEAGDVLAGRSARLLLAGRRIWTFRLPDEPDEGGPRFSVRWPAGLRDRLHGTATLSIESRGVVVAPERPVRFDDTDAELVLEEPGTGVPLIVNKWGRITRSFEGRDPALLEGVLDETERLVEFCRTSLGIDLFVIGGTLLGPFRDGRIMAHDDDADLAYLSRYDNPSDLSLESFRLERALVAAGYEVVRHSSGHLQIMFPGRAVLDRYYIDIFTYFVCEGWFYGPFHARQPESEVRILPLGEIDVNGRRLPAPADPASLLAAIYGPGWRKPDPAFVFVTPPAAARRFFWWLNHYDVDRENWEDLHRAELESGRRPGPSEFAREVERMLPAGDPVLELGCGLGVDAAYLASAGHPVLAVDYSRPALVSAVERADGASAPVFHRANLNNVRDAARVRRMTATDAVTHVVARGLFDSLPALGWDVTLNLMRHLLAGGRGLAFVEVEAGEPDPSSSWTDHGPVDRARFGRKIAEYGFTIDSDTVSATTEDGRTTHRLVLRRERP